MKKRPRTAHIIAYNIHPTAGSEEAVAWSFTLIAARYFDSIVITTQRGAVLSDEAYCRQLPENAATEIYNPRWMAWLQSKGLNVLHYLLWHLAVYCRSKSKGNIEQHYDLSHVVTWANGILPALSVLSHPKTIWGPLGGIDLAPPDFYKTHAPRSRSKEWARRFFIQSSPWNILLRRCYKHATLCLAATDTTGNWLRSKMDLSAQKIAVCPGIFVPDEIRKKKIVQTSPFTAEDSFLNVVTACRLIAWKGTDLLIEGLRRSKNRKIILHIYGEGPQRNTLERAAAELLEAAQVIFYGRQPRLEVLRAMSHADLFALPSLHDSQGGVYMEAAELGTPVMMLSLGGGADCLEKASQLTVLKAENREEAVDQIARFFDQLQPFRPEVRSSHLASDSLLYLKNREAFMFEHYERLLKDEEGPRKPGGNNSPHLS